MATVSTSLIDCITSALRSWLLIIMVIIIEAMSDRPKYVRLRGLPFSSKENDIRTFLDGCCLTIVSLPLNPEGRPSGEGFVGLKTEEDVQNALAKNKELIQKRYIEVFRISHEELANALRRGFISEEGRLIKLRGLPFSASDKDIKEFLSDVEVEEVVFGRNAEGRPSGEAFVRLASKDDVKAALLKNKQHMGKRYVEVYDSKPEEINRARGLGPQRNGPPALRDIGHPLPLMHGPPMPGFEMDARSPRGGMGGPPCGPPMWDDGRGGGMPPMMEMERTFPQRPSRIVDYDEMYEGGAGRGGPIRAVPPSMGMYSRASPYDGGGGGGVEDWNSPTKILMKGLPFDVNPHAIERFFAPLRCFDIKIGFNEERRPSGDGSVEFGTISETREALQRHKQTIGQRYIELYSSSEVPPSIRRIRFKRVGGAMSVPPAPLTTPSHRSMPAAPIPTGRPPIPPPRFEQPMMGGGGPPHRGPPRGYEDQMGGGYGMPSPAVRGPPSRGVPPPPPSGRNDGAYSSFPSREYNGVPQERENYGGYGRAAQESYAPPSVNTHAPPSYGMYDVKPEVKREVYDGYGRGGGDGYGSGGGYGGYGDEGMAPPQRTADPYGGTPRRPAPAHNGGGDYTGYEGYGSGGGGGQYGGRNAGGGDRYF